jgi:quercetin dioxygenase-like cupin family protein
MSSRSATVGSWRNTDPIETTTGVNRYELISPDATPAKRVGVSLITIEPGKIFNPELFQGETFYFVLAGNGILWRDRGRTYLPGLIENDMGGWIPGSIEHRFENTGEGPMRCLAVSCETDNEYGPREGGLVKLDTVRPDSRKIYDSWYEFNIGPGRKLTVVGYQVFVPGGELGWHSHDEEVSYLVRGKGKLATEEDEFELTAGTAMHIPENIDHKLTNTGEDQFGYIAMEFD